MKDNHSLFIDVFNLQILMDKQSVYTNTDHKDLPSRPPNCTLFLTSFLSAILENEPTPTLGTRPPGCSVVHDARPVSQINTPRWTLTIRQRFSCTTSNLVYIITCPACTLSYVGETGRRLGDRFCEHLRSVSKKADLPVAKHFSSPGHTTDDMMVAVVRAGLHNTRDRRRAEGRLIFKCKTLQPRGINIDVNFI